MDCKHTRLPCPSPTPGACSNSYPSSRWCHPTISSSVIPFSSCLPSFPASGSFPMSQFFTSGGQSVGVSASASVLSMNIPDWFPVGWTGWISFQTKGCSRVFSNTTVQKHQFFALSFLYSPTLRSIHVQSSHSVVFDFLQPQNWGSLSITNSRSLPKLMSIESVMPSIHLILCCPLLLPSIFPNIRVFSNDSALRMRWPKYWSFSFSISPSNEYSGLISFRIDFFF